MATKQFVKSGYPQTVEGDTTLFAGNCLANPHACHRPNWESSRLEALRLSVQAPKIKCAGTRRYVR